MATPSKRKALTLSERVKAIGLIDRGMSCRKVAEHFSVGKTQVQSLLKRKREILDDYDNNCPDERKRKSRKTGNEDINMLLWEWFKEASDRTVVITGPMLREKGLKFAKDLGVLDFKASNGWLDSFCKRHNVKFGNMCGESGDVKMTVVNEWKEKLPTLCKDYAPRDIFNMDETGLFFRATASKSFHIKGEKCSGGKMSKERITVALCANMLGEKEPALVIGKSLKPRCFKKVSASSLPVKYYSNKKAWMTSVIFEDWVKSFDRKMRRQGRKVILFLDNAPSHPNLDLQSVKLQFLPPNTTCKSQPMDQGIIQAVKLKYRKRQLQQVLRLMDRFPTMTGSQLLKQVNLLDAIYWLNRAWEEVDVTTVVKCFGACGFADSEVQVKQDELSDTETDDDDIPLEVFRLSKEMFGIPFEELREIDKDLATCVDGVRDWEANAQDLLESLNSVNGGSGDEHEDSDIEEESVPDDVVTSSEAQFYVYKLRQHALSKGDGSLLNSIMDVEHKMVVGSSRKKIQSDLSNFFVRTPGKDMDRV